MLSLSISGSIARYRDMLLLLPLGQSGRWVRRVISIMRLIIIKLGGKKTTFKLLFKADVAAEGLLLRPGGLISVGFAWLCKSMAT